MISEWQFNTALNVLIRLDMEELVNAGVIEDRDYETWDAFRADPVKWYLSHPHRAGMVWQAIMRHRPSSQVAEPAQTQDNIVDLGLRRADKS